MSTVVQMSRATAKKTGITRAQTHKQLSAIARWNVPPNVEIDPGEWIQKAVEGQAHQWIARSIWSNQPNLRHATERLASFITPWMPDVNGQLLLPKAIMTAVTKAQESIRDGDGSRLGRLTGVYLHGLTAIAEEIARVQVSGIDGDGCLCRWNHFSEPIFDWARSLKLSELMAHAADPAPTDAMILGVRTHMIASLTDPVDAGYLAKHAPMG